MKLCAERIKKNIHKKTHSKEAKTKTSTNARNFMFQTVMAEKKRGLGKNQD